MNLKNLENSVQLYQLLSNFVQQITFSNNTLPEGIISNLFGGRTSSLGICLQIHILHQIFLILSYRHFLTELFQKVFTFNLFGGRYHHILNLLKQVCRSIYDLQYDVKLFPSTPCQQHTEPSSSTEPYSYQSHNPKFEVEKHMKEKNQIIQPNPIQQVHLIISGSSFETSFEYTQRSFC